MGVEHETCVMNVMQNDLNAAEDSLRADLLHNHACTATNLRSPGIQQQDTLLDAC